MTAGSRAFSPWSETNGSNFLLRQQAEKIMTNMRRGRYLIAASLTGAVLGIAVWQASAQQAPNAFPLAAPAGRDKHARAVAPPGSVNQGPFNMSTWKYGAAFNTPAGGKIWKPAPIKLM